MKLHSDTNTADYQIQSYTENTININGSTYDHSLLLTPAQLITDWPVNSVAALTPETCSPIIAAQPDIILLGLGNRFVMPPASQLAPLYAAGFSVDVMTIAAACRAFTLLSCDNRNVLAALILPSSTS